MINNNTVLFSVIIPTYNREKLIKRSVESVLSQTIKDFEIIVVDDGSTDNTEQVVQSINDPRIVFIRQRNKGATAARNNGVSHAQGKYISFLDSDDVWYPLMLEKQLEKFNSDSEICCVYSDLNVITPNGKTIQFWAPTCIEGFVYKEALIQGYLSPMIVLSVKKRCFDEVGMFDENLPASQDDDICFKLAKKFKFGYIPYQLAGVYTDVGNRISGSSQKVSLGWWMLWNKYEDDVVKYCGNEVIANKYSQCARRFSLCGNSELMNKALDKILQNGGSVSILQKLFLTLCCKGVAKGLIGKILNKIM